MKINKRTSMHGIPIYITIIICGILILSGCTAPAAESPPPGTMLPTETTSAIKTTPTKTTQTTTTTTSPPPTTQPPTTQPITETPTPPPEPEPWFDVSQYTGIPLANCKEPVTDLTGLPPAPFNLTVNMTKQVGVLDNSRWTNVGVGFPYCAITEDNMRLFEINRQTGAIKYMRIFSIFSDGLSKWFIDAYPEFLNDGQLPDWLNDATITDGRWAYTEDENGNPVYNFWHIDGILDNLLSASIKPIFCVGYMPEALAEGKKLRTTGGDLVNTPNDYNKWRELVYQTVKHCIERYGADEVRTWYWELWNEPDIDTFFIDASKTMPGCDPQRYLKMYDYFGAGVKAADSQVKIGGPTAGLSQELLRAFLYHCVNGTNYATGKTGAPLDFIVWHGFDSIDKLAEYNRNMMNIVKQFPSLKNIPILEDEWGQSLLVMNPTGHVTENYVYSEEQYNNHEAAFVCKFFDATLADPENQPDMLARAGFLTSSTSLYRYFSIAALNYFIPMPIFNLYLLLAKMGKEQVELTGSSYGNAVHGFAARTSNGVQVLLYNFNETDRHNAGTSTSVNLTITGLSEELTTMKRYLIDSQNSNPWTGYPFEISWWLIPQEQLVQMEKNSRLKIVEQTDTLKVGKGQVTLRLTLPVNSVSLVVIGEEAAPPVFSPSPHIARVIQEESAYKAAKVKLESGDIDGAKAGFEQLVADSFAAVTDESSNNTYSIWGQKALWQLLDIAKNTGDYDYADTLRLSLLSTTLTDVQRYMLLYERLRYLETSGNQDELQAVSTELQALQTKLEYLFSWTNWTRDWDKDIE